MSRGHDRERDVADLLERWGWVCVRSAGSLGPVDVVALGDGLLKYPGDANWGLRRLHLVSVVRAALLIEVKSTAKGPYEQFGPADRATLREMADRCGGRPVLAYWPKCKPGQRKTATLQWIWGDEWPT